MIITRLCGGLGNQLFQYAFARRIAYINNVPLKIDVSLFDQDELRSYKLSHFQIVAELATSTDLEFFINAQSRGVTARFINKCRPYYKRYYIKEKSCDFDANLLKSSGRVFLEGYWQSEKYFCDIDSILRSEFILKKEFDEGNKLILEKIRSVNAVCLHVRRGDYVSNPETYRAFGVCSLEYYKNAVTMIENLVTVPHFFVFSDDPAWAQENIKLSHPMTFVTHNGAERDYEDLCLMAACKHYIIANSSFSWWAGWLGNYAGKIVIAPKRWVNDPSFNSPNRIPKAWLKI